MSRKTRNRKRKTKNWTPQNRPIETLHVNRNEQLLEYLLSELPNYSRNKVKGFLRRKQVAVNGVPVSQFDYPLTKKDTVVIHERSIVTHQQEIERLNIIYEDEDFLVINKPAGLLSVASDTEKRHTAYRYASDYLKLSNPRARVYVVHRIDKETSGVLMFVKRAALRDAFTKRWNDLVKERAYVAVTAGVPAKKEDVLKDYLFTNFTNLMYVGNKSPDSVLAITKYKVVAANEKYALLDIRIETGKKNQIRVQLKNIGTPVIGDDKYDIKENPLDRLGLHAYRLVFNHPNSNKRFEFKAPIPVSFENVVK